tara:strand:- start:165 stop:611 length:447 start_codon:yes stop_codon:yes gene_type:complete
MIYKILYFFLSLFYVGKIKYAPGTIASVVTACIWYKLNIPNNIQIIIIIFIVVLGLFLCKWYSKYNKCKDPSFIVVDEVAGMSIALFMVPKIVSLYFLSFLFFRFFDIYKPGFISNSEKIENGIGIMLDDIISGLISFFLIHLIIYWI